jgi:bacteriophage N4 adsorption protein B
VRGCARATGMTAFVQLALFYLLVYFLVNGVDDLGMDLRALRVWLRRRNTQRRLKASRPGSLPAKSAANCGSLPDLDELRSVPAQRIAILVPLWQEASVVEAMVETNLRQVDYPIYDLFLGVYLNDPETLAAASRLAKRHPRVHVGICSRPGPTSKANCLNELYRHLQDTEERLGCRFPLLMLHDAEDMLHPASLLLTNWFSASHGMVQIPVLPVATPIGAWIHGIYCDEFAEFLARDLAVRSAEGGFLPSNGVGTCLTREALQSLLREGDQLFDEECLTEDYEIGLRIHLAGHKQILLPLGTEYGSLLATREYFPQTLPGAIRQRTRWISGQCLQSWERNGWPLRWKVLYWFWRDRKGLLGNFLNVLALFLLAVSVSALVAPELTGLGPWLWIAGSVPGASLLFATCTVLALQRLIARTVLVAHIYGWRFAAAVPLRVWLSICLNAIATANALRVYAVARWRRKRLTWMKTEHAFPEAMSSLAEVSPAPLLAMSAAAGASGGISAQTPAIGEGTAASARPQPAVVRQVQNGEAHRQDSQNRNVTAGSEPVTATRRIANGLYPLEIRDGEVVVMVPAGLSPAERRSLMRHRVARVIYIEEGDAVGESNPSPQKDFT